MMAQAVIKQFSPAGQRKKYPAPKRPSIEELKKKYENTTIAKTPKSQNSNIQELKKKYEPPIALETPKTPKPKSPKMFKKSKVKQMASMFNSKISQITKGEAADVNKHSALVNELSPEAKPQPEALLPKPVALPKTRYNNAEAPMPSPRAKSKAKLPQKSICYVAEDIFNKLTVKEKVLLYTQFIEDMSKKNPKFSKHVELMEANVKKEVARGEVVNEKQASVKYLRDELEARCAFPKQTISALALQRMNSSKRINRRFKTIATNFVKSKEFEDIKEQKISHISTLFVTLQSKPDIKKQRRARSLPRCRIDTDHSLKEFVITEPSHKRNNGEMRSSLPIEAYAPPKKIRRTRGERLSPNIFFQNQQLEHLFFSWLNDRQQHKEIEVEKTPLAEIDEEKQKSTIEKMLEEAIAKLETVESKEKEKLHIEEKDVDTKASGSKAKAQENKKPRETTPKITPRKKKPAPAVPQLCLKPTASSESSTTSSAKHSEAEEYESGLSLLPKITSEESQAEFYQNAIANKEKDFDFAKPLKPLRKKKMRKKDSALLETNKTNSTDSEPDYKITETKTKNKSLFIPTTSEEKQKVADFTKESLPEAKITETKTKNKSLFIPTTSEEKKELDGITKESLPEPRSAELDETLMRDVNSPRKIKSAYTLTMFSPPPPYDEKEEINQMETTQHVNREASRSWPSLAGNQNENDLTMEIKAQSSELVDVLKNPEPRTLGDSSIDQGFETGSNEIDSPIRSSRRSSLKRQDKLSSPLLASDSRRVSIDPNCKIPENPSGFSTPIKGHLQQQSRSNSSAAQQQLLSPITLPLKNRRKSVYDSESRRSSLAMQVIREDHPLEHHEIVSPPAINTTEQIFFANAPTLDITTDMTGLNSDKTSRFWIKCGDFSISLDIYYNDAERVRLLYDIFSQRSCDTKDLHFGIDDHKFSVHNSNDHENIPKRLPNNKECSHYWFSTGDLAIPFAGKLLTSEKIQRIFQLIKATVEETGILMFGVDEVEFSNVQVCWNQSPKFSMESSYSMLVGLQSGNSNGLEGRSKYAWPHSKPVRVSDLDQSDSECEDFEENESGRISFSPFRSSNSYMSFLDNSDAAIPRNSELMISPESFCYEYENEPLDQLFDPKYAREHRFESTKIEDKSKNETSLLADTTPVSEMLSSLKCQQQRLNLVQEKLSLYTEPFKLTSDALDALKGTPEYLVRLKNIVSDIKNIGSKMGFNNCPPEVLESYMFFLSRYADICLHSCSDHMEKVLDALLDQRAEVA